MQYNIYKLKQCVNSMNVVTRFPPSPTGDLHIGSARTALYNWLFARKYGGELVFRLEDTDRERSTEQAVEAIVEGMRWLGLDYDSGPYYQTDRFKRYKEVVDQLLDSGCAYRCYCDRERLDKLREEQTAAKIKPRYDGYCRDRHSDVQNESYVVRFRTPLNGTTKIDDKVHGLVTIENSELDDLIIMRSDGVPTYHLTVVVDDFDMNVTHIIRGDDHLNNTARQLHIIEALEAPRPVYAHIPMINGVDGKRLSKRDGATSVLSYRDEGILPHALLNYLVRLGWSQGDDEIFSIDQMIEQFNLDGINKSASAFDQEKLLWFNQHYIHEAPLEELAEHARPYFAKAGLHIKDEEKFRLVVGAQRTRVKTLVEIVEKSAPFYGPFLGHDESAAKKHLRGIVLEPLEDIRELLREQNPWTAAELHTLVETVASRSNMKLGKVAQPLRVAVTGVAASPGIDVTLFLIGREECLKRLDLALAYIKNRVQSA
jgi:glutamyl-tRNA synthetase